MKKIKLVLNPEEEVQFNELGKLLAGVSLEGLEDLSGPNAGCSDHCRNSCSYHCEDSCADSCAMKSKAKACAYKSVSPHPFTV